MSITDAGKRPMTRMMSTAYELALRLELSNPLGRAAYAANRAWNGGLSSRWYQVAGGESPTLSALRHSMEKAKEQTAARWEGHWLAGGSLKTLRCTEAQWLEERRNRDKKIREIWAKVKTNRVPRIFPATCAACDMDVCEIHKESAR